MDAPGKAAKKNVTRRKTARKAAVQEKPSQKKSSSKKSATAIARARTSAVLDRLERELPPTLRDYSRRVRQQLGKLEQEIGRTQARYRRQAVRLLREGSHRLGSLEALGERGWRKLSERTRKEILNILRRLEHAVETAGTQKPTRRKKTAGKAKRKTRARPRMATSPSQDSGESNEIRDIFQTPSSLGG